MPSFEEPKGADAPPSEAAPVDSAPSQPEATTLPAEKVIDSQATEDGYGPYDDPYAYGGDVPASTALVPASGGASTPPPPPKVADDEDEDDEGMLRMSFLEHLEELRTRIIRALLGMGIAFAACLAFSKDLWYFVQGPAETALKNIGAKPTLVFTTPMEGFATVWVKVPILAAIFVASPWLLYQVWGFIAPGLYKRERRWAAPFVIVSAGLFILGGLFAYFVVFRFGLEFLLGIGRDVNIEPMVKVSDYFDLFVNVMLGVGLVFEMPVIIFFLTLLRITTPAFLVRNSRYAILIIVVIAAIITPTPDIINLMLFAVPMCLLFYVGVFASYLLWLKREEQRFPWAKVLPYVAAAALVVAGLIWLATAKYGYHLVWRWPFLIR